MEYAPGSDDLPTFKAPPQAAPSLRPSPFNIQGREVLNVGSPEEGEEILAEFDFLIHYTKKMGAAIGSKNVSKLILKEDQTLLGFHILSKDDILGYQSSRPYPFTETFGLF